MFVVRVPLYVLTLLLLQACGGPARPVDALVSDGTLSAAAQLGKAVFHDVTLSASGRMSCASCHDPARGHGHGAHGAIVLHRGLVAAPARSALQWRHRTEEAEMTLLTVWPEADASTELLRTSDAEARSEEHTSELQSH